jgi:hypothetical protein
VNIAVYAIAKDEARHAERFMASTAGADSVVVCDTGSKDGTQDILRRLGATVHEIQVSPWRFDLARNMALLHVQDADVVISLDLDEVLVPGWRQVVEQAWESDATMLRYPLVHNWEDREQTIPRMSVWGFKAHHPAAYVWRYPMHETLESTGHLPEKIVYTDLEIIRHYPDADKQERWSRIALLEQAVKDAPACQRMSHLLGRELFFHQRYVEAIAELKRHLSITEPYIEPGEDVDGIGQTRSTSCRLIARSLMAAYGNPDEILVWMLRAVGESASQREPWVWLAQGWSVVGDYASAYAAAMRGLAITDRRGSQEIEEFAWGTYPQELASKAFELMGRTITTSPHAPPQRRR